MDFLHSLHFKLHQLGVSQKDQLIVAVSGGLDSMVLWEGLRNLKYSAKAVHINYNLRGEESAQDEHFVRAYAEKHDLPITVFQANPEDFKTNLQEEARKFRYAKFDEVRQKTAAEWILTAHHQGDDQETFFLNLVRGAGLNGLKGITEKREHFLRPLLSFSKAELKDYADSVGLQWREDESNQTDKYLRNKIRHLVIPALLDSDERASSGIKNSLQALKAQNEVFKLLVENYRKKHLELNEGLTSLKLTEELTQNPQLLFEVLSPYGHFEVEQIIVSKNETGKKFYAKDHTVFIDRGRLLIQSNSEKEQKEEEIQEGSQHDRAGLLRFETLFALPKSFAYSNKIATFDFDKLQFPLVLRPWQPGDSFQPFGMEGHKKVSDYLTDAKVPLPLKHKALVLQSGGKIVWLVGHRMDDRFKLTSKTKKIYLANLLK